jgi:hypothetical protein
LLHLEKRPEVAQGGHRGLFQIDIRARREGDRCQFEVRTEWRGDDHDVHRPDCRQRLGQIGVQVDAVNGGRVEDDARVDRRDEFDQALI